MNSLKFIQEEQCLFCNVNFNNLENVLHRNLRANRARECIFRAIGGTILKMYLRSAKHGGAFMVLIYVTVNPKYSGYITDSSHHQCL